MPLRGQFSPYSTATSRMAIRGWLPWVLDRTVCHETWPSTTLNRPPSTIPEFAKTKPQVESLPIFEKAGYGRPLRPKRSRWALFVAQRQTSLLWTGLFWLHADLIAQVVKKPRPKLATLWVVGDKDCRSICPTGICRWREWFDFEPEWQPEAKFRVTQIATILSI